MEEFLEMFDLKLKGNIIYNNNIDAGYIINEDNITYIRCKTEYGYMMAYIEKGIIRFEMFNGINLMGIACIKDGHLGKMQYAVNNENAKVYCADNDKMPHLL